MIVIIMVMTDLYVVMNTVSNDIVFCCRLHRCRRRRLK